MYFFERNTVVCVFAFLLNQNIVVYIVGFAFNIFALCSIMINNFMFKCIVKKLKSPFGG